MKTFFSAGPVCTHADTINKYDDRLGRVVRFIASSGAADGSKVAVRRFILGRPTFSSAKNRTQLRSAEYDVLLTKVDTPSWNEIIRGGVFAGLGSLGDARVVDVLALWTTDRAKPMDARAAAARGLGILASTKRIDPGEAIRS